MLLFISICIVLLAQNSMPAGAVLTVSCKTSATYFEPAVECQQFGQEGGSVIQGGPVLNMNCKGRRLASFTGGAGATVELCHLGAVTANSGGELTVLLSSITGNAIVRPNAALLLNGTYILGNLTCQGKCSIRVRQNPTTFAIEVVPGAHLNLVEFEYSEIIIYNFGTCTIGRVLRPTWIRVIGLPCTWGTTQITGRRLLGVIPRKKTATVSYSASFATNTTSLNATVTVTHHFRTATISGTAERSVRKSPHYSRSHTKSRSSLVATHTRSVRFGSSTISKVAATSISRTRTITGSVERVLRRRVTRVNSRSATLPAKIQIGTFAGLYSSLGQGGVVGGYVVSSTGMVSPGAASQSARLGAALSMVACLRELPEYPSYTEYPIHFTDEYRESIVIAAATNFIAQLILWIAYLCGAKWKWPAVVGALLLGYQGPILARDLVGWWDNSILMWGALIMSISAATHPLIMMLRKPLAFATVVYKDNSVERKARNIRAGAIFVDYESEWEGFSEMYGEYLGPARNHGSLHVRIGVLLDFWAGIVAGIVDGLRPSTGACATYSYIILGVCALYAGYQLYVRPCWLWFDRISAVARASAQLAVAALACVAVTEDGLWGATQISTLVLGCYMPIEFGISLYAEWRIARKCEKLLDGGGCGSRGTPISNAPLTNPLLTIV